MNASRKLAGLQDRIIAEAAVSHPSLTRGQVWCRSCGATQKVNSAGALRNGWPKCCGATMTIDSPEEQAALDASARYERSPVIEGEGALAEHNPSPPHLSQGA